MIPVFQTRYAPETFGNCFEACLASILELPLVAVPDRAAFVDEDAWADQVAQARLRGGERAVGNLDLPETWHEGEDALRDWLEARGLGWFDYRLGGRYERPKDWLAYAETHLASSYWIGHVTTANGWIHATVWQGGKLEHDPHRDGAWPRTRDGQLIGTSALMDSVARKLVKATLLVAGNPALIARTLDPLPDVAGLLESAAA